MVRRVIHVIWNPDAHASIAIIRESQVSVMRGVRFGISSGGEPIRAAVLCVNIDISIMPHISCINLYLQLNPTRMKTKDRGGR